MDILCPFYVNSGDTYTQVQEITEPQIPPCNLPPILSPAALIPEQRKKYQVDTRLNINPGSTSRFLLLFY